MLCIISQPVGSNKLDNSVRKLDVLGIAKVEFTLGECSRILNAKVTIVAEVLEQETYKELTENIILEGKAKVFSLSNEIFYLSDLCSHIFTLEIDNKGFYCTQMGKGYYLY
jgi:hypothetical protein